MNYTEHISEALAVLSTIDPVSQGVGTVTGDAVSMQYCRKLLFILNVGAMTATSTVDFKLQQGIGSAMGTPIDITGKAITQLTQAGSDQNKQVLIEVRAEELDLINGYNHVRPSVTVAAAASLISVVGLGALSRFCPASDFDLASVDEIVTA